MITTRTADAIVIGSGLTGGWAAQQLSEAGLETIVLEAGPLLGPAEAFDTTAWTPERRTQFAEQQPIQSRHASYWHANPALFVDDASHPYTSTTPDPYVWIRSRQVGGRSLLWGGVTLRFSDYEFQPAWPIDYADLAHSYGVVESALNVQGSYDGLPQLPDGCFSTPPPLTPCEQRFKTVVEEKWKDRNVIVARGVPLRCDAEHECNREWPPKTNLNNTLWRALRTGRTTVRPNSIVSHLLADPCGPRISGAACIDRETGAAFEVSGRVIVLCASAIESVRILLNSKCPRRPAGVGNSSGLLGRYLLDHMVVWTAGPVPDDGEPFPVGGAHGILIPRFKNLGKVDSQYVGGYGIWGAMQRSAGPSQPQNMWCLNALLEVMPCAENRIELDDTQVDAWGIPVPRITMQYSDNELSMKRDALAAMLEMCRAADLPVACRGATLPGQYVHELGGARMGSQPSNSVVNSANQCWDAPNLFVVDGSCFPTAGWQNPALTMMALTVRACAFIIDELGRDNL